MNSDDLFSQGTLISVWLKATPSDCGQSRGQAVSYSRGSYLTLRAAAARCRSSQRAYFTPGATISLDRKVSAGTSCCTEDQRVCKSKPKFSRRPGPEASQARRRSSYSGTNCYPGNVASGHSLNMKSMAAPSARSAHVPDESSSPGRWLEILHIV